MRYKFGAQNYKKMTSHHHIKDITRSCRDSKSKYEKSYDFESRQLPIEKCDLDAFKNTIVYNGTALISMPDESMTPEEYYELCLNIIEYDGRALQYISPTSRTAELCELAIYNYGLLCDVPMELRTAKLYMSAINNGCNFLDSVPIEFQTVEFVTSAVATAGINLKWVPLHLRTLQLCEIAIRTFKDALLYIPAEFHTYELFMKAVKNNGKSLKHVPIDMRTARLCTVATRQTYKALGYVPESLMTPDMYTNIIRHNGCALQYVPTAQRTFQLCKIAYENTHVALQFIPRQFFPEIFKM